MRTLLIIIGLALPIVVFVILSQPTSTALRVNKEAATPSVPSEDTTKELVKDVKKETKSSEVSSDPVQAPDGVKPGGMSAPSVILPKIGASAVKKTSRKNFETLEAAKQKTEGRLAYLRTLTQADWPAERRRHLNAPPTLEQALRYNRDRLAYLMRLTPEQWEKQQSAEGKGRRGGGKAAATSSKQPQSWAEMSEEQKLKAIKQQQQKLKTLRQELEEDVKQ